MRFGARHEWGRLREVVVGIAPADEIVLFHEEPVRGMPPALAALSEAQAGHRLIDIDPEWARRCESQVEALAALLAREGITVHRPTRLAGSERHFLAPKGEGSQLFVRDPLIAVDDHLVEAAPRRLSRQRERYGLRAVARDAATRQGARWSAVPLGVPNGVDGPYLEGGDVLLNGGEVYVGMSGCASDLAGADWLQHLLGERARVIAMAMRSHVRHLDDCLALIRPGLLVYCPDRLIDGLPMALRDWDKVEVSADEAARLATHLLVLDANRVITHSDNGRVSDELRRRGIEVVALPFDAPIRLGGGVRAACLALDRDGAAD